MQKTLLYPDGGFYSIEELEKRLGFTYLPHNAFEAPHDRQDIRERGIDKWKKGEIPLEAEELGRRFIQEIELAALPAVSIRWIQDEVGYGLFAEKDLAAGTYAGEYTGIVRKNDRHGELNNYLYEYPIPDPIGRSFVIDATQGHLTRFINHSFTPNLKPIHVFHDGFYHLIFLALHPILKGAQLTFNYGKNYWYVREPPLPLF